MGNNNSTFEYSQSRSLKKSSSLLRKNHSHYNKRVLKLFIQNVNSLDDSSSLDSNPSVSTLINISPPNEELLNYKNKNFIKHSNSNSWDSSTSTLNNNFLNKSNITTFLDEKLSSSQMSSGVEPTSAIGHITNTSIVDEPDEISNATFGGHDNSSDETAALNPSSLFYSEKFYSLPEVHVLSLLQKDDIEITEIEIWNHLITWGIKNTLQLSTKIFLEWNELDFDALKETLKNCIPWIRFFQIKPQDFAKYVWPFKQILPKSTIGNFLRLQITGHPPIMEINRTPPRIPSTDIDSTVITGRHATIIASWMQEGEPVGGKIPFNFNLLYRASKDVLSLKNFGEKCDDNGPTILVIKLLDSNQIVGVYNPLSYQNSKRRSIIYRNISKRESLDTYLSTKEAKKEAKKDTFLFSFKSHYPEESANISRIIPEYSDEAIIKHSYNGLCFGIGPDLLVNLDENEKTGEVFHSSYQNPILNFEGIFEFEELEVFQVLRKAERQL